MGGNDVRLIEKGPAGPLPKVIPSDVIPSFAYGRKSRPSTPIASVVGYQYAAEYEEALDMNYQRYDVMRQQTCGKHRVRLTKASTSRIQGAREKENSFAADTPPPELFKLTKFKKVPSRLQLVPLDKSGSGPLSKSASAPTLAQEMMQD